MRALPIIATVLIGLSAPTWAGAPPTKDTSPPASPASAAAVAVASQPATTNTVAQPETQRQSAITELERQNALLKQQYELARGFQSDVLTTVWGALTVLFAMTLGLIAFGWWTNFRMYERPGHALYRINATLPTGRPDRTQANCTLVRQAALKAQPVKMVNPGPEHVMIRRR
jgi:hypothetical protein